MATRSRIGIVNPSGSITSVYCHHDGYPRHHAPILLDHYTTAAKVRALMKLGNLSVLGEQLGEKHAMDDFKSHPTWCKAYNRDRGETGEGPVRDKTLKEFIQEEHHYLFKEGQWWYVERDSLALVDLRVASITDRLTAE